MCDPKRRNFLFLMFYAVLFALTAAVVFHYFPETGRRMVWKRDGLTQHYTALRYYSRWGRAVLRSILAGRPSFPTFNLHIGFGSDLLTTFQYYVIGDPFSLPAVFVPQRHLLAFHDAMIILRLFLAGICFDRYCCEMGHRQLAPNLCGALLYIFGNWTLFGMRHPYFLNALIWFPLLLTGAEHILRGRRGRLFTLAVFLSCISNFYFFYMLVLLTAAYAVWRTLRMHVFPCLTGALPRPEWKKTWLLAARFFARAALGTGLGMCLFLPVVLRFLGDPRASEGTSAMLLYPADFYTGFAETFLSFGTKRALEYWTCMGYGAAGLLGVLTLFLSPARPAPACPDTESHPDLKLALLCMLAMTLLPAAGSVLNGFSYPSNRWIWAFSLLIAYIVVVMIPEIPLLSRRRMALLLVSLGLYAAACRAGGAPASTIAEVLLTAALALGIRLTGNTGLGTNPGTNPALPNRNREAGRQMAGPAGDTGPGTDLALPKRGRETDRQMAGPAGDTGAALISARAALCSLILIAATVATAALHSYVCFKIGKRNSDIEQYKTDKYIEAMVHSDAAGVRQVVDKAGEETFYRYSARDLANNFSVLHDVSNMQYFWSLSDSSVVRFFTETGQGNESVHIYDNLDNRTMLDEIAGVKYYKRGDGSLLPFGYQKLEGLKYDNRGMFPQEETDADKIPVVSFAVYKNQYALPLGFTSDRVIPKSEWEKLSLPRRQEALMQGIVLEDEDIEAHGLRGLRNLRSHHSTPGVRDHHSLLSNQSLRGNRGLHGLRSLQQGAETPEEPELSFTEKELPESIRAEEGIRVGRTKEGDLELTVLDHHAAVSLAQEDMQGTAGCETSVLFTDMSYRELSGTDAETAAAEQASGTDAETAAAAQAPGTDAETAAAVQGSGRRTRKHASIEPVKIVVKARRGGETVSNKTVSYSLEDNPWTTGRDDFLSCCGYSDNPLEEISLNFSRRGVYTFRNLKVICQPMQAYPAQARALRSCVLEDLKLHELEGSGATNRITGRITVTHSPRVLCLQIPRVRGMQAFVDGKQVPLLRADTLFSAVILDEGEHDIEFRYHTPGLAAGTLISLLTLLILLAEQFRQRRHA